MRRYALMIGLLLLLVSPQSNALAKSPDEPGKLPPDRIEIQGGSREDDCDCCQKCQAAKREITPKEEPGADLKDGCAECCDRCEKALPTSPEETPPDIIEKPKQ